MIKVAICDDEPVILELMHSVIHQTFRSDAFPCEISCFHSGEKMLEFHKNHPFDILFLDILMPDRNGFDIAKEVRAISNKTLLLFVTSQDELVYDSFNYHPFYFLRKGDGSTFAKSLSNITKKITDFISRNKMISLELNSGESKCICLQELLYIKSNRNFVDYHLVSGDYIPVRNKIKSVQEELATYGFVRIHKQYIANINKIQRLNISRYPEIILSSGKALPIGRKYKESVILKYKEHLRTII